MQSKLAKIWTFILEITRERNMPQAWNFTVHWVKGGWFDQTNFGGVWYGTFEEISFDLSGSIRKIYYLFLRDSV